MCTCRCPRHLYSSARRLSSLAPRPVFSEWVDGFRWVLLGGLIYTQDRFQIPCLWQSGNIGIILWEHSIWSRTLPIVALSCASNMEPMANMDPSMWSYILAPSYGCLGALRIKPPGASEPEGSAFGCFFGVYLHKLTQSIYC